MKLKVTKKVDPSEDGGKKPKVRVKGKNLSTQYGMYSGNVDENGKTNDNPTEGEAMGTMVDYMKNNRPEADSRGGSNVYRPQFSHITMAYDRKKKQDNG